MSIQWTVIATFLYIEIAIVLLLVLPVANPKRWQKFFKSKFLAALSQQASFYFYVLLFILVLFLLDAIRELRKYSNSESNEKTHVHTNLDSEMQANMRLFRAQRNFYISGFALFLSLVIRRLCTLITTLANMQAQSEAALKQAVSATTTAKKLLSGDMESNEAHKKEVESLKSEISKLKKELEAEKVDKETVKKQAESTNAEYDRLTEEYNKLQKKIELNSGGDKKDD